MEEKSKVMAKWQTVIPKKVRKAAKINVGDVITWTYEAGRIIILPPRRISNPSKVLYGLIPSSKDAIKEVKRVREERLGKGPS